MLDSMFALSKEYYLTQDYETERKPYVMGRDHIGYVGIGGQTLDPTGIADNKELFNVRIMDRGVEVAYERFAKES